MTDGALVRTARRRFVTPVVSAGRSSKSKPLLVVVRPLLPVVRPLPSRLLCSLAHPSRQNPAVATLSNSPPDAATSNGANGNNSPTSSTYSAIANFAPLTISAGDQQQGYGGGLGKVEEDVYGGAGTGEGMWQ
jgi:hypothetical protein